MIHRAIFFSLFTLAAVASTVADDETNPTKPGSETNSVRVMSFNLRYGSANDGENHWTKRRDFVLDTIKAFNPDVLGTQETLRFQADYLKENLPGYAWIGVGRNDGGEQGEMTAIFYRKDRFDVVKSGHFWLSESPEKPGSKSWDSSLPRMATWIELRDKRDNEKRTFRIFNTHFDHRGSKARLESAKLIRKRISAMAKGAPVILTGDFNCGQGSEPYQAMFAKAGDDASPVIDTYRAAHPKRGDDEGTFSGFKPGNTGGARIDWVACSRDWTVNSAAIDRTSKAGRTPSDHFPVTAVLAWPQ